MISRMKELRTAQVRIETLQQELATARARQNWTPDAAQFAMLERKMDEIERDQVTGRARHQRGMPLRHHATTECQHCVACVNVCCHAPAEDEMEAWSAAR